MFTEKELVDLTIAIGLMNAYNRLAIGFRREHLSTVSRGPRRASYLSDVPLWKGTVLDERRGSRTEHHVDAGNRRSAASEPAAGSDA